jgi:hypothetical protein
MESLAKLALSLVGLIVLALPFAWLISEFTDKRWLRLLLGIATLTVGLVAADGFGNMGGQFEANSWFATNNTRLIDSAVSELERGHADKVLASLKQLQSQYHPNYENRSHFDTLVDQAINTMKSTTQPSP